MRSKHFLTGMLLGSAVLFFSATSTALGGAIFIPSQIVDPNPINFDSLLSGVSLQNQPGGADALIDEGIQFLNLDGGEVVIGFGNQLIDVSGEGGGSDGMIEISFVNPVRAAGVDYWSASTLHFLAYDEYNVLILDVDVESGTGFFGVGVDVEGTLIKRIVIHDSVWGFGIDNLRRDLSPVPLPGAALLGVIGLAAVRWAKRRLL